MTADLRYYSYDDCTTEHAYRCYLELDAAAFCMRAVYQVGDRYINTSKTIEHAVLGLPEGAFTDLDLLDVSAEEEFREAWTRSISPILEEWTRVIRTLGIGATMSCEIVCFYPQGTIVRIDGRFYGLMNFAACEAAIGMDSMYPGTTLQGTVSGFDDDNLWVLLNPIPGH